jgi:hypothetical protein
LPGREIVLAERPEASAEALTAPAETKQTAGATSGAQANPPDAASGPQTHSADAPSGPEPEPADAARCARTKTCRSAEEPRTAARDPA